MTTLAMATPSISKRARSAPKIRSALSTLLPQSNGNLPVTILMSRRFASAAAVRRDASHHQAATIMPKAPTSAAPLNAPRPAARPMSIMCRFTIGQRLDRTFQFGLCRATRFSIGDGKRATAFLRDNPVYRGDAAESKIAARRALLISEAGVAMRVLIAGATGAIGRQLVRCLNRDHHSVFALARSPESSRAVTELGAEPVTADALDAAAVKAVIARVRL